MEIELRVVGAREALQRLMGRRPLRLYTDAACGVTSGLAAIMVENGQPVAWAISGFNACGSQVGETRALKMGLELYREQFDGRPLTVFSDSRDLVDRVRRGRVSGTTGKAVLVLASRTNIVWVPRELNDFTDTLSKTAQGLPPGQSMKGEGAPPRRLESKPAVHRVPGPKPERVMEVLEDPRRLRDVLSSYHPASRAARQGWKPTRILPLAYEDDSLGEMKQPEWLQVRQALFTQAQVKRVRRAAMTQVPQARLEKVVDRALRWMARGMPSRPALALAMLKHGMQPHPALLGGEAEIGPALLAKLEKKGARKAA